MLEHRYAAVLLSSLLTGGPLEELGDPVLKPCQIRLQASEFSPVDDVVIIGRRPRGSEEFAACIGVRRDPDVVPSDAATVKLIANYLREVTEHWGEIESGHRRLVLAVTNRSEHAFQLARLAGLAESRNALDFRAEAAKSGPTDAPLRSRLRSFDAVVAKAAEQAGLDTTSLTADELTWRLLKSLKVQHLRLEGATELDRTQAVGRLRQFAFEDTAESAEAAFALIERRVGDWAPNAARVTEPMLRRALAARLRQRFSTPPAPTGSPKVESDAVMRGPLASLGLERDFMAAQALESSAPADAAAGYERLGDQLSAWPAFALSMRRRQAVSLHKAGDHDAGTAIDVSVMAAALQAGEPWLASSVIARLSEENIEASDHLIRVANALGDLAAFEHGHEVSLDDVTTTIEALRPQDPHAVFAATWFAEHAIAMERLDLLKPLSAVLDDLADSAAESEVEFQARLRACLADTDHSGARWVRLRQASHPPHLASLLRARYARFLAENGRGEESVEHYGDAIERAVRLEHHADAAAWLEARSLAQIRYSPQLDGADAYPKTSVLRSASQASSIPSPFSARERALGRLAHRSHPAECRAALVHYRRHAAASAGWSAEREAHELLGRLHLDHHLAHDAVGPLVAAGSTKLLHELVEHLPEEPADLPQPLGWPDLPRWKRKSLFLAARTMADLMPDQQARAWADLALKEITGFETKPPLHPVTHEAALAYIQAAAPAFTADQAHRFITITEHWPQTGTTADPRVGRPYANTLLTIARQHRGILQVEAVDRLCQAMLDDYTMSLAVLRQADVLRLQPSVVSDRCSTPTGPGALKAALALTLAGSPAGQYRPMAQSLLDAHLAKPGSAKPSPEATLERTSRLAAHLLATTQCQEFTTALIDIAQDHDQPTRRRQDALYALGHMAPRLTTRQRSQCFDTAMDATRGTLDGGNGNSRQASHPLARFRFNHGPDTLRYAGIHAAVSLARTEAHASQIAAEAFPLLAHCEEDTDRIIATALADLSPEFLAPLIPVLAGHSSPWARALAAHLWCYSGAVPDRRLGLLLASDPSRHVRRNLASSLPQDHSYAEIRSVLSHDCRRSVRHQSAECF
ncbi:hypothetical protein ABZ318_26755 [Streptomyces sp. NPDC006197]|uniref:hypothetical protein n=1 Tax=Streptomyces sp. NPDC006197 TaxID=3156685 RepID=UPI0033A6591C